MLQKSIGIFLLLGTAMVHAEGYVLGQGYNLGAWNISGYTTVKFKVPIQNKAPAEIVLDDLALFVQANLHPYLNPFFEIEYAAQPLWINGQGAFSKSGRFVVERLYNDMQVTEALTIRLGKMLAPLTEWNQIHANPLVATVTRPLSSYVSFSNFISGVALHYQTEVEWLPNIQVYYQPWEELLPKSINHSPTRYKNISGFNLQYGDEFSGRIAFAMQHAELTTRKEQQTLFSVDGAYDFDDFKVSTQFFYATIAGNELTRQRNEEWGGYVQVHAFLNEQWSLVGRSEVFMQRDANQAHYNTVLGMNYRPQNAMVWKLEYVLQRGAVLNLPEGVYGSFGVMF